MRKAVIHQLSTLFLCAALLPMATTAQSEDVAWLEFSSSRFDQPIVRLQGVFTPLEAEKKVLPFMDDYRDLFEGKSVLEIGCGSGIVSVHAAKLGAVRVVATDINPDAIRSVRENARRLGFEDIVDARLVPPSDMTAYSVIRDGEKFDVVLSNPPYALDLDAPANTHATDTGDLGFSILRGFGDHVEPEGLVLLYYGSLFYHSVMVKFARYEGFEVRHNLPRRLVPWEAETIFNAYLKRFLEYQGLDKDAFRFRSKGLKGIVVEAKHPPLFPGREGRAHPGWIVIHRPHAAPTS